MANPENGFFIVLHRHWSQWRLSRACIVIVIRVGLRISTRDLVRGSPISLTSGIYRAQLVLWAC